MGTLATKSAIISEYELKRIAGGSPVICCHRVTKTFVGRSATASAAVARGSFSGGAEETMRLQRPRSGFGLRLRPGW
ncbi:protein of unassigned function [Methylobacterium oryzae CBMB20]|uniref:Protein of unassigned function n=1 Tax=Methylobacterium oryzae CBMB20 TaxID=693986 RepID=A0A089NIR0_9HYPH|nr:protein of unassigned function [Methylobacterium oryzae CBMB20]